MLDALYEYVERIEKKLNALDDMPELETNDLDNMIEHCLDHMDEVEQTLVDMQAYLDNINWED